MTSTRCAFQKWAHDKHVVAGHPDVAVTYEYAREELPEAIGRTINGDLFASYLHKADGKDPAWCSRPGGVVGIFPFRCPENNCRRTHLLVVASKTAAGNIARQVGELARTCDMLALARPTSRSGSIEQWWGEDSESGSSWSGAFSGSEKLWSFLALRYTARLEELLERDYRRYYLAEERVLRGRFKGHLLIGRYLNRLAVGRPDLLPCRWQRFTYDNWDNRVLGAALKECARIAQPGSAFSDWIGDRVTDPFFRATFDEVKQLMPWEVDTSKAKLRGVSIHYRECLALAEQILKSGGGAVTDPPLVHPMWIDTHKLFEGFVTAIVDAAAKSRGLVAEPQSGNAKLFEGDKGPDTIPDIVVRNPQNHGVQLVVDAKYKTLLEVSSTPSERPDEMVQKITGVKTPNADMYQMFFYLSSRRCGLGLIVFPYWSQKGEPCELVEPNDHRFNVPATEKRVRFLGLNLARDVRTVFKSAKTAVESHCLDRSFSIAQAPTMAAGETSR